MASISGLCSSSSSSNLIPKSHLPWTLSYPIETSKTSFSGMNTSSTKTSYNLLLTHSVARDVPISLSKTADVAKKGLETDPKALWERYTEWLYQHKELGLYIDVSRVGFSDEFVKEMEPRFNKAFKDMVELEKGAISNPDEGRMVGHYWLRNPKLAPNSFLRLQIENTLEAISSFSQQIIEAKVCLLDPISFFKM